ncbi:MAG: MotA/TolQ/ExbB proton channel family protein [Bacteroidales bacterium]
MDILGKMKDGGPVITYTILVIILIIIALSVLSFLKREENSKYVSLLASFGWFALAWGYMGRTFGLIMAFDRIAAAGEIAPELMAGGLKMALIGPLMGLFAFLIARTVIIVLTWTGKRTG